MTFPLSSSVKYFDSDDDDDCESDVSVIFPTDLLVDCSGDCDSVHVFFFRSRSVTL